MDLKNVKLRGLGVTDITFVEGTTIFIGFMFVKLLPLAVSTNLSLYSEGVVPAGTVIFIFTTFVVFAGKLNPEGTSSTHGLVYQYQPLHRSDLSAMS